MILKRLAKVLGILFFLVAVCISTMLVLGSRLPLAHTASASIVVPASQARVWQYIEDVNTQPQWRTGLTAVQSLPAQNGHNCWLEIQKYGKIPMCEILSAPPAVRIVEIADPKLAFGGTWTYQLSPVDDSTTNLLITEHGTTGPLLWRYIGHYIFHEDTMIKQYEAALQKAASEPK